jgi:demethylmenaquinone methyltransferase/2-methoxy-6-polyprenyl-1,4-benzoquinol methylase
MPAGPHDDSIIEDQVAYYRARAPEYDDRLVELNQYMSLGGTVGGPTDDPHGDREIASALEKLNRLLPVGHVLELACGTGWWTQWLARSAGLVTAVDAAPEMLALNRERVAQSNVRYEQADLFSWRPHEQYDLVFFAFWLSHVPEDRFKAFWRLVEEALAPHGRFFFIDELRNRPDLQHEEELGGGMVSRRLKDGRTFRAVKIYHDPTELQRRLTGMGWDAVVESCGSYFYVGYGGRASTARHSSKP